MSAACLLASVRKVATSNAVWSRKDGILSLCIKYKFVWTAMKTAKLPFDLKPLIIFALKLIL